MLRVISRPITVPAERIALLNAGLSITFSSIPGSASRGLRLARGAGSAGVDRQRRRQLRVAAGGGAAGGGASLADSRS